MTDLLRVQFWIRGAGVTLSKRGGEYSCLEAEGTQPINAIGSGRVVIPFYDDQQRHSSWKPSNTATARMR